MPRLVTVVSTVVNAIACPLFRYADISSWALEHFIWVALISWKRKATVNCNAIVILLWCLLQIHKRWLKMSSQSMLTENEKIISHAAATEGFETQGGKVLERAKGAYTWTYMKVGVEGKGLPLCCFCSNATYHVHIWLPKKCFSRKVWSAKHCVLSNQITVKVFIL